MTSFFDLSESKKKGLNVKELCEYAERLENEAVRYAPFSARPGLVCKNVSIINASLFTNLNSKMYKYKNA